MKRPNTFPLICGLGLLNSCWNTYGWSVAPSPALNQRRSSIPARSGLAFPLHAVTSDISLKTFDGTKGIDESTIIKAAEFMIESFWGVSDTSSNPALLSEQVLDLDTRFGEILGKRKLFSNLIVAKAEEEIVGMVGVEVALVGLEDVKILNYKQSEKTLTDAVASLGPKQRREFKDASIEELVSQLPSLQGNYEAVAVLANLCVSPSARGSGLGEKLCRAVEEIVTEEWGMEKGKMMLKVEGENVPAKKLYEKVGYKEELSEGDAVALRPDMDNGGFCEIPCEMLTLSKSL